MIVPPAPTIIEIGLNAAGGAARNGATQATMSIMLLRWRTARLKVIDQRHCRVQRSTASTKSRSFIGERHDDDERGEKRGGSEVAGHDLMHKGHD